MHKLVSDWPEWPVGWSCEGLKQAAVQAVRCSHITSPPLGEGCFHVEPRRETAAEGGTRGFRGCRARLGCGLRCLLRWCTGKLTYDRCAVALRSSVVALLVSCWTVRRRLNCQERCVFGGRLQAFGCLGSQSSKMRWLVNQFIIPLYHRDAEHVSNNNNNNNNNHVRWIKHPSY